MNEKNCSLTGIHQPIPNGDYFQCRWCHRMMDQTGMLLAKQDKKPKTKETVYAELVIHYIDVKHYSKQRANEIAQKVIEDQIARGKLK